MESAAQTPFDKPTSKRQHVDASDSAVSAQSAADLEGPEPEDTASSATDSEDADADTRPRKRRKTRPTPESTKPPTCPLPLHQPLPTLSTTPLTAPFPSRAHRQTYHHPLLLAAPPARAALLAWFAAVYATRSMPWRKPFLPPPTPSTLTPTPTPNPALARRAYEVWISEIMLQQTRVQAVIPYWNRWMARWPTLGALARAAEDEVVALWQGLGYYSRARRVLEAARLVHAEMGGLLPGSVRGLLRVPGVGRYTAGAVAAIAFGVPAAMVDGNVARVLSRQMGLLGDVKGDRRVVGLLWEAAEELVAAVVRDGGGAEGVPSDRPGRWGQALMELGSTVCTPKPNCAVCPVTATCRAYAEGSALAAGRRRDADELQDIEDPCGLCAPFGEVAEQGEDARGKQSTAQSDFQGQSPFFEAASRTTKSRRSKATGPELGALETIINHARKFPLKRPRKKVREEEALVCAIRDADGRYLIHRRPDKGLLAGLWELPSHTLPASNDSTAKTRNPKAISYVLSLGAQTKGKTAKGSAPRHLGELGSIPWQFSHLKLTMHVHLFELDDVWAAVKIGATQQWASGEEIERESMGTGMKKCWSLVKAQMD
ncbi:DNA glycosylase [Trichocladium antarcticum]|uniref:Adenine DNA glycosylase n=1 Tax=Trichocladium antarcticum TaxID=1450529 RepID=A0AAN6UQE8_9PEZI|nr:DNA glycosylase [Trichocladium antarcticum]